MKNNSNTCEDLLAEQEKTLPRGYREVAAAMDDFRTAYASVNSKISFETIALDASKFIPHLTENPEDPCTGLVLHYGLSKKPRKLEYILSRGSLENDSGKLIIRYTPFVKADGSEYYLLINGQDPTRSLEEIDTKSFLKSAERYFKKLKMNYNGTTERIKNIADHPRRIYHQGSELNKFVMHNQGLAPSVLYIKHGKSWTMGQPEPFHVPLLLWGNKVSAYDLDPVSSNRSYERRALDIGHVCPPYCEDPTPGPAEPA